MITSICHQVNKCSFILYTSFAFLSSTGGKMKKIANYQILNIWKENNQQTIYMAVNSKDEEQIVLVNKIKKGNFIDQLTFQSLLSKLTNLCHHQEGKDFILVSSYNGGLPIINYLKANQLSSDKKAALFAELLKKFKSYDNLAPKLKNLLVDTQNIIIEDEQIFLNEILDLSHLDTAKSYHHEVKRLSELLLTGEHALKKEYFDSEEFLATKEFSAILTAYQNYEVATADNTKPEAEVPTSKILIHGKDGDQVIELIAEESAEEFIVAEAETEDEIIVGAIPDEDNEEKAIITNPTLKKLLPLLLGVGLFMIIIFAFFNGGNNKDTQQKVVKGLDFNLHQNQQSWQLEGIVPEEANAEIMSYVWQIIKDGKLVYTGRGRKTEFKPNEDGEYLVSLIAVNADGDFSQPEMKVVDKQGENFTVHQPTAEQIAKNDSMIAKIKEDEKLSFADTSEKGAEQTKSNDNQNQVANLPTPAAGSNGQVVKDSKIKQFAEESSRITKPNDQYYKIYQVDKLISDGDIASMWFRTNNNKGVSIKLVGYENGQKTLEEKNYYSLGMVDSFNMYTYTFNNVNLDHLDIYVKSDCDYLWYEAITVGEIK